MPHEAARRLHFLAGSPSLLAFRGVRLLRNVTLRNPGTDPRGHSTGKMKAYAVVIDEITEIKCEGVNPLKRQHSTGVRSSPRTYTLPTSQLKIPACLIGKT